LCMWLEPTDRGPLDPAAKPQDVLGNPDGGRPGSLLVVCARPGDPCAG
jgi:hypothetical protein